MGQLSKQFVALSLLILNACSTMQVSDFQVFVQLPASGDCFGIKVVSKEETRLPKPQCEKLVKRGLILTSENWRMIKEDIQVNCQNFECQQLTGKFDALFLAIDKALQQVP